MKNVHLIDRYLRLVLGVMLALLGYFWLASPWSWLAFVAAIAMFGTAIFRFCPIYRLLGVKSSTDVKPLGALSSGLALVVLAALIVGGGYGSAFFTRKFFLEDFNAMNHFYKQTLFLTGKEQRPEAIANFDKLQPAFAAFTAKYTAYRPYDIKGDAALTGDFAAVGKILSDVEPLVRSGDLRQAHLDLEKIRPIFQEIFKRNGFSMVSIALVDFHDAMELILTAANEKDAAKAAALYPEISDKLKAVEAEANDDEIKAIRAALDDVLATAGSTQLDSLPTKGETLKGSFVKVYLKRG
jgi:Protein of unknown function (DUF2892)